jgi:hypothetical protein
MNELVIVNIRQMYSESTRILSKNIKMYFNEIMNQDNYKLVVDHHKQIRLYKFLRKRESAIFIGYIKKSRNKKLFNTLYLTIRINDE